MDLLEKMRDASNNLTMGEKFLGSLQVTLIGVAIVFIALFLLFITIVFMEKMINGRPKKVEKPEKSKEETDEGGSAEEEEVDDRELVAVITAAIAATLHTSTHNIVVRNIKRVPDSTPAWGKLGRMQQLNSRF